MEQTECSKTLEFKLQTPLNHPKQSMQQNRGCSNPLWLPSVKHDHTIIISVMQKKWASLHSKTHSDHTDHTTTEIIQRWTKMQCTSITVWYNMIYFYPYVTNKLLKILNRHVRRYLVMNQTAWKIVSHTVSVTNHKKRSYCIRQWTVPTYATCQLLCWCGIE
jgi:protoheme ferro-lyase